MKYAFHVKSTEAVATKVDSRHRAAIAKNVITEVERMKVHKKDIVIFDEHQFGIKVVVMFADRTIWLMTPMEAAEKHLPGRPPLSTDN